MANLHAPGCPAFRAEYGVCSCGAHARCVPRTDVAAVEAANVALSTENAQLRQALRVIRKGLTDDPDGEFWPARRWLDRRGIFHGDLSGNRVLELVARRALHGDLSWPHCVCEVEDGLVREWVQKAASVARAKGYRVGSGTEAPSGHSDPTRRSEAP